MKKRNRSTSVMVQQKLSPQKINTNFNQDTITHEMDRTAAALAISETQYRRLFETAKDGILILDAEDGMIMDVNPFLINLLGYTKEDFIEKAIWEIGLFKDIIANYDKFKELQLKEYVRYEDLPLETSYGQMINVEFVSNVYLVNDHKVIQCNIRDITARKKAEQEHKMYAAILGILNRNNEWQNLINDILKEIKSFSGFDDVGILLKKDGEDYSYYNKNETNATITTMAINELEFQPKAYDDLKTSDYIFPKCPCNLVLSGRTDATKSYFTEGGSFWTNQSAELRNFINDPILNNSLKDICNHARYLSIAFIPIHSRDKIIGILQLKDKHLGRLNLERVKFYEKIALAIGIADRRIRSDNRTKESEEKFRSYIEHSPVGIFVIDINGNYYDCNQAAHQMLGYTREELLNLNIKDIVSLEDIEKGLRSFMELTEKGNSNIEIKLLQKNKSSVPVLLESVQLPKINKFMAFCTDISERIEAEKVIIIEKEHAEESDRLKSAFLANMSHEIRTPLNGILGFSELLKEPNLTGDEQQRYINIIEKSGIRMLNTINDLIDISRIESGIIEVNISETNINEQNENLYLFFKQEAEKKGLKIYLQNSLTTEESIIYTDKEKINDILTNLVKNAIKFTDEGSIEFGYKKLDNYFEFFVKDTGIGISPEQKEIVFERFRQVENGFSRGYEGSGLGLSISKAYVEMLGGKIWVESEIGKGTSFYYTIPVNCKNPEIDVIENVLHTEVIKNHAKNLKILIVDDDESAQLLVSISLGGNCKEILLSDNGIDAVEKCRNNPDIDMVLMDIRMPGIDGYEATRQIRQFNKEVIIIAQTAFALSIDREKALQSGCTDYISKPIDPNRLRALVEKNFSNKDIHILS